MLVDIDLSKAARIILIEVLEEFGGLQSVPSLIIALGDPDPAVQQEAKDAIALIDPALGPALARYLTQPARPLSKQQRKNLAESLGQQGSAQALPQLQQAAQNELNPEVKQALAKAIETINAQPKTAPAPATPPPQPQTQTAASTSAQSKTPPSNQRASQSQQPPPQINISVSASATATATVESDEEKAEQLAREGAQHLENGDRDKALVAYQQAYALVGRRMWLLIIFDLQGIDPDSVGADSASTQVASGPNELVPIEEPAPPITLAEIHQALNEPEPSLEQFSGGSGAWEGNLESITPLARDGIRELFMARGSPTGQDFIVSLAPRERALRNIEAGMTRRWGGMLRGFRIIDDNGTSRMLPVLAVQQIE